MLTLKFNRILFATLALLWCASCAVHQSSQPVFQPDTLESLSLEELLAVRVEGEYTGAGIYQSPENPVTQDSINFAVLMPLGTFPRYATSIFATADLAASRINQSGGINGKPVAIIRADINHSRNSAVTFARQLIEDYNVVALFGPGTTEETRAVMESVSIPYHVPLITASASSVSLNDLFPEALFWRLSANNYQQAQAMVEFLKSNNSEQRVALVSGKGIYGQELSVGIRERLPDSEFIELSYSSLVNLDKIDLKRDLAALEAFKPDAIIFTIHSYIVESYFSRFELFWKGELPTLIAGDVLVKANDERVASYRRIANCLHIIEPGGVMPAELDSELQKRFKYDAFGFAAANFYDAIILMALAVEIQQSSGLPMHQVMQQLTRGDSNFDGLKLSEARVLNQGKRSIHYQGASGKVRFDAKGNNEFAVINIEKYWTAKSSEKSLNCRSH